jgi:beta-lactamase class A
VTAEDRFWRRLEEAVIAAVEAFAGVAGVCLLEARGGRSLAVQADLEFGTASAIKAAILCQLLRRVEGGELDLTERRLVRPEDQVGGSGTLQTCVDPVELSVRDLCRLMIVYSDNTATNACIELAGGCAAVNALLDELGLRRTRLRRRMMDWQAAARGEQNVSTPAEMARFYQLLAEGRVLGPAGTETALGILRLPKGSPFSSLARPDMAVADKPGGMTAIRCDAGYFFQPRRPFALAIMTSYGPADADVWLRDLAGRVAAAMATIDAVLDGGLPA